MTAPLVVGERLISAPCDVSVERVGWSCAWAYCKTCDAVHIIDRTMVEAGAGPWRRVADNGSDRV